MYTEIKFDTSLKIHKELSKIVGTQKSSNDEILFLENDNSLPYDSAAYNFRQWCIENKVVHNCLYEVSTLPVRFADLIVFETTGRDGVVKQLHDYIISVKDKQMNVLECFIHTPVFGRMPKESIHKMWSLNCYGDDMNYWELFKLSKNKYYSNNLVSGKL
jgi:hypothetical protein